MGLYERTQQHITEFTSFQISFTLSDEYCVVQPFALPMPTAWDVLHHFTRTCYQWKWPSKIAGKENKCPTQTNS